jgi:RNA polymerase II C-terminal domain phosphatase-like 3/4
VHAFLAAVRPLYELHIYTMGDRAYAARVRQLLDPRRTHMFTSVISACDSTSTAAKDLDVVMADERMVLILDDTEQVWAVMECRFCTASFVLWRLFDDKA